MNIPAGSGSKPLRKVLALLLVFAAAAGMLAAAAPAGAAGQTAPPSSVTLVNVDYSNPGNSQSQQNKQKYTSPNGEISGAYFHTFTVDMDGSETIALCLDHGKWLNNTYEGKTWTSPSLSTLPEECLRMLDLYYYMFDRHQEMHAKLGIPCTDQNDRDVIDGKYGTEYSSDVTKWDLDTWNPVFQGIVWLASVGAIDKPMSEPEDAKKIEAERKSILEFFGYSSTEEDNHTIISAWIERLKIDDTGNKDYIPHYKYYSYQYSDSRVQSILVPVREENPDVPEKKPVYVKIQKIAADTRDPLADCTFGIFDDEACKHKVGSMITGKDTWTVSGPVYVDPAKGDSFTLWIKETGCPAGYTPSGQAFSVQVDRNKNNTAETAAEVSQAFVNTRETPGKPEGVIQKIDADSGMGAGPAVFHFEGKADDGSHVSADWTTSSDGSLELQWYDPAGENYIKPGTYSVTEKEPPPGYDRTDESRTLTLMYDEATGEATHTGPLVFSNTRSRIITLKKLDPEGNGLAGAVFRIYRDGVVLTDVTTDATGSFTFDGIDGQGVEPGRYVLEEIKAPDGYLIPFEHTVSLYITEDRNNRVQEHVVTFTDSAWPEIHILKQENGTEKRLEGAVFQIKIDGTDFGTFSTGVSGEILISHEEYGKLWEELNSRSHTVQVREVTGPAGYFVDSSDWQDAVLTEGQDLAVFTFTDTPYPELEILKQDQDTGEPLAGAVFDVAVDGSSIGSWTTGGDGTIHIGWEEYGSFLSSEEDGSFAVTVRETAAPAGYFLPDEPEQTKTVTRGMKKLTFTFSDHRYPDIEILKTDADTGEPLAGAVFDVSIGGDSAGSFTTGEDGKITLTWDQYGKFLTESGSCRVTVTETSPPGGYMADRPASQTKTLTPGMKLLQFTFVDTAYPEIEILKLDADTEEPLSGAVFEVEIEGSRIGSYETNQDGIIRIGWEEYGRFLSPETDTDFTVTVRETGAPAGYFLPDRPEQTASFSRGMKKLTFTFTDHRYPDIEILKTDSETGKGLAGAVFDVSIGSESVGSFTTGEDGKITLTWDQYGKFLTESGSCLVTATETSPPDGWLADLPASQSKTLEPGMKLLQFTFVDIKYPEIEVLKRDVETDAPLPGATFRIEIDDYTLGEFTTGEDGKVHITYEELSRFLPDETRESWTITVTELEAPEGYSRDPLEDGGFTLTQELKRGQSKAVFEFRDTSYRDILVIKRALEDGHLLAGANFALDSVTLDDPEQGEVHREGVTDENGQLLFEDIPCGTYTVREKIPPDGYLLTDPDSVTLTVTSDSEGVIEVEFDNPPMPHIVVNKVDAVTGLPLPGAVFELRHADGTPAGTFTTDASGSFTTDGLLPGVYELVEVEAPEGYALDSTPVKVVVRGDSTAVTVTIKNAPGTAVQLEKVDAVTGEHLAGAEIELWTLNCQKLLGTYTTDEAGLAFTPPLPEGTYVVKEGKAPEGYLLNEEHFHVQVVSGVQPVVKIEDIPLTAIHILKLSSEDGQPLAGARFQVKTAEGDMVGEYTTDTAGTAVTPPLEPGVYYVQEVEAPDLYLLNPKIFRVEVKAGTAASLTVEDAPAASLVIFKGDRLTGRGLAGAIFKVETANGDFIGSYTTDAQGEALIRPVSPGHYIVTETAPPEGYILDETPQTITVKPGVVNRVEFFDASKGALVLRLEDAADGHKLENGRFELYYAATGEKVGEGVTDDSGSIVWGNLEPGLYTAVQTYPPDGYSILDREKSVTVELGDTKELVFRDLTSGLVIEKIDRLTETPLAGARFQVTRNADNLVIGEYVTDVDGLALVSGLVPGMYTVEELDAPEGYELDSEAQLVHVHATEVAHATFRDTPFAGITVETRDDTTDQPVPEVRIELWQQNGERLNSFTTDSTGTFRTDALPAGFYVLKVVHVPDGYAAVTEEQTVEVRDGEPVTVTFRFTASGLLRILAYGDGDRGLAGMRVRLERISGEFLGEYTTDVTGLAQVSGLEPGWYVVTETAAPGGYSLGEQVTQKVEIRSGESAEIVFRHVKTWGVQIRTSVRQTGAMVPGVKYRITTLEGTLVGDFTSSGDGLVFASLEPGWYVFTMTELPKGFEDTELCPSRNVEVKAGSITVVDFVLEVLSGVRVRFVDGASGSPLYNVRLLVKDAAGALAGEYWSTNEGLVTLSQTLLEGTYTLEILAVPEGYTPDPMPRTVEIRTGETTEVTWQLWQQAGQIQVHLTSDAYSSMLDLPQGSNLPGAVFEVYDPFSLAVLEEIQTDSSGIAATHGLPVGRYLIREKSPAPYFAMSGRTAELYIRTAEDVERAEFTQSPLALDAVLSVTGNQNVVPGTSMKFVFSNVDSNSAEKLDSFFWTVKIPTDAMRGGTLFTGKWSADVFYSISYKTNMQDWRPLAENLSSGSTYQFDLSSLALSTQSGEYVTDIRFEFGTVPGGFHVVTAPVFYGYVLPDVVPGYKIILRSECGGKYMDVWETASALWTVNALAGGASPSLPSQLPKTGY